MTIKFAQQGLHRPVLVIAPETQEERILLAAFLIYDANILNADVARFANGLIDTVTISASEAR